MNPNVGRLLVKLDTSAPGEMKTAGGLFIPQTVQSDDTTRQGTVAAVGPTRCVDGFPTHLEFHEGDRVILDSLGGTKVKILGDEYVLVRGEDVLVKI